jgi:hypothetical protein
MLAQIGLTEVRMTRNAEESWISFHLYYHEDLNHAVVGFAHPTVLSLLRKSWIDGFFFVRYGLGGPHLRLRLLPLPGKAEQVAVVVRREAERFLTESPSVATVDEVLLRRANAAILTGDPHEIDDSIYPDNTFLATTFRPETYRYGGPELLPASLDFFTLSSALALDVLQRHSGESRARQLLLFLRLLLRQALYFAVDKEELLALAGYGVESWGEALPTILAKGDKIFAGQREIFHDLFRREIRSPSPAEPVSGLVDLLGVAAAQLSGLVGKDDCSLRQRIGISQLHMTATRLGLSNIEETYISRLLYSTTREFLEEDSTAASFLTRPREAGGEALCDLLPRAFAFLLEGAS